MTLARAARLALGVMILSTSALIACKADETVLDAIFSCDPEAGDAQCGTDENGEPMTCYVGSAQLGGTAFCTKRCDPAREAAEGFTCTSSGALLERCHPRKKDIACQDPLQCYRTDALFDDGLCLWVPICKYAADQTTLDNGQCGISRPVCAGELLRELASGSALAGALQIENLHCVAEPPCAMNGCPTTGLPEDCPSTFFGTNFGLPITCAAPCDRFTCPPNFACAGSAGAGSPALCLPGVPGVRCASSEDCLVGDCIDSGAGFGFCTLPTGCDTDDDCRVYGTSPPFTCLEGIPDDEAGAFCTSTIPFSGTNCEQSSECSEELTCGSEPCPPRECAHYSAHELNPSHGDCRFSCNPADGCPRFGGLPHVCLPITEGSDEGGCYPGTSGVPCSSPDDCYANLICANVPPDERSRTDDPYICTVSCETDDDCTPERNPWFGTGYCVEAPDADPGTVRYCRIGAQPDRPCDKPEHCLSRQCVLMEDGVRRCAPQ